MSPGLPVSRIAELDFPRPPKIAEPDCRHAANLRRLNLDESLLAPSPKATQAKTARPKAELRLFAELRSAFMLHRSYTAPWDTPLGS